MVASIIMAVINAIVTIVGLGITAHNVNKTNKANLDLYQQQAADQYNLWQESNAYNSPAAQMLRYREAGLNPNLAIGNSGNSSMMSLPSLPRMEAPDWGASIQAASTGIDTFQQAELQRQQIYESQARERNFGAQANLAVSKQAYNVLRNTAFEKGDFFGRYVELQREKLNNALYGNSLLKLQKEFYEDTMALRRDMMAAQLGLVDRQQKTEDAKHDLYVAQKAHNYKQVSYLQSLIRKYTLESDFFEDNYDLNSLLLSRSLDMTFHKQHLMNAQEDYYGERANYTHRKYKWIPVEGLGLGNLAGPLFNAAIKLIK